VQVAFGVRGDWNRFEVEGQSRPPGQLPPVTLIRFVSEAYFRVLGIPVMRGRDFSSDDRPDRSLVAVVNRAFAVHQMQTDPIGARIRVGAGAWMAVVGVVGNTTEMNLRDAAMDEVYYSLEQLAPVPSGDWVRTLMVRSNADPSGLANQIRRAIARATPDIAISHVTTLADAREQSLASSRVLTYLVAIFAAIASVVAIAGVSGIVGVSVGQRRKEIALRRTLGAQSTHIVLSVLGREIVAVAVGLLAGLIAIGALARGFKTFLFDVPPVDVPTIAAMSLAFLAGSLLASYAAISRSVSVQPRELLSS
jgi:hypothetical protein